MPDRPPLIDVANARGASHTGGPIPPSPEQLEEVYAVREDLVDGEVLTVVDGRPEWAPAAGGPGGGAGVNYVATAAELPASASGHPVVLVLEDELVQGAASLRYWNGTGWALLGLAGGGTVASDFIDVDVDLAGMAAGKTLVWTADHFIPGALS